MEPVEKAERVLSLEGGRNFRDMGGYEGADGRRVRWGKLYRAGGLGKLTQDGVYPPDWVTEAGKPVPGRAWRRYDVFGDDEAVAVTFSYGEAEHAIVARVDLTGYPTAVVVGARRAANIGFEVSHRSSPIDAVVEVDDMPSTAARGQA